MRAGFMQDMVSKASVALLSCLLCIPAPAEEQEKQPENEKLEVLFDKCLHAAGPAYVEARDQILKQEGLADFLRAKLEQIDRFEKTLRTGYRAPKTRAQCLYLFSWIKNRERYTKVAGFVTRYQGPIGGPPVWHPDWRARHVARPMYSELEKEKASLFLLVEGLDKGVHCARDGGWFFGTLHLLIDLYDGPMDESTNMFIKRPYVPKEVWLSETEKAVLVDVLNRLVVSARPAGWEPARLEEPTYIRRYCARLLGILKSPSSVLPLIQAGMVETDESTIRNIKRALKTCAEWKEGRDAVNAAKGSFEEILSPQ